MTEPVLSAEEKARNRRFFSYACLGTVALLAYGTFTAKVDDPLHLYEGLIIIFLAVLPSILWTRKPSQQLPILEAFMLTFINAYGLPLLTGHAQLQAYPVDVITSSGFMIIAFQTAALLTYYNIRVLPQRGSFWTDEIIPDQLGRYLGYGLILNTIYTIISTFYPVIPADLNSILRAVFFGIGVICTFIQSYRWGKGELSHGEKPYMIINLFIQCVVLATSLLLTYAISLLVLGLLGYVAGGRRVPVFTCVILFTIVAIFHNGKSAMRAKYWESPDSKTTVVNLGDLPQFFLEWFQYGISIKPEENKSTANKLLDRTSLLQMMCLVVNASPEHQPFLNGLTYSYIPGQFVSRFFWPAKPPVTIATSTLSIYYGLQDEDATAKTTIAFGIIVEAYANFGLMGVVLVGVIVGGCLRLVHCWTLNSPIFSYAGIFTIILLAWSFQIEMVMCVWLSSLYQAVITALGLPFALRNLLK